MGVLSMKFEFHYESSSRRWDQHLSGSSRFPKVQQRDNLNYGRTLPDGICHSNVPLTSKTFHVGHLDDSRMEAEMWLPHQVIRSTHWCPLSATGTHRKKRKFLENIKFPTIGIPTSRIVWELKVFFGFHNWEIYRKFYVFNMFLTSSPDWELWCFLWWQCVAYISVSTQSDKWPNTTCGNSWEWAGSAAPIVGIQADAEPVIVWTLTPMEQQFCFST